MKKTLLLADDSPTIQKVINLTFADEGIDVIAVSDGNAAIQQLREMTPDLVMADVHMPGLNGYQICERLRQNAELKNVPVILLVGSFEPFDEEEAKRVGADDFLMKPFQSIRQLVSRVGALLEPAQPETAESVIEPVSESESTAGALSAAGEPEISEITESLEAEMAETAPEMAEEYSSSDSNLGDEMLAETVPGETIAAELPSQEVFDEEDDDLLNFDREFDKKFPDAASLSSGQIDSADFAQPEQGYAPEQNYSGEETPAEPVQYEEVVPFAAESAESYEAAPAEPVQHRDGVPFAAESYEPPPAQTEPHEDEASLVEENYVETPVQTPAETALETAQLETEVSLPEENTETQPFPEDDLNRLVALQQPERISDEVEEKSIELATPETSESSSILDLGNLGRFFGVRGATEAREATGESREADALLDIDTGEAGEDRYVTPITEAVDEIVAEKTIEVSGEATSRETTFDEAKYDFRSPDAFDEDADIEETFHGLAAIEEEPVPVFQAPLERVVDEDVKPGNVSEDQADGFSGLTVPPAGPEVPQEAIDAAAQKVFEQISEKVVTEMVRGLMPQIRDLVAREIAKENE